jgi:transcriptional regulator with XRE-family HTH domain
LRSIRESRGLSQSELSRIAGITQSNLSAYENDRRLPSISIVNRIVASCGYILRVEGAPLSVQVPLPRGSWVPFEDLPDGEDLDVGTPGSGMQHDAPMDERVMTIDRVLQLADRQRAER